MNARAAATPIRWQLDAGLAAISGALAGHFSAYIVLRAPAPLAERVAMNCEFVRVP